MCGILAIPRLGNPFSLEEGKARSWEEDLDHAKKTGHYQWYVDSWRPRRGKLDSLTDTQMILGKLFSREGEATFSR